MASFVTLKDTLEAELALKANGVEPIIVDGELLAIKVGSLRIAPEKSCLLLVTAELNENG